MKEIEIKTTIGVFDSLNDLPTDIQSLMHQAIETRKNAYAPYSKFRVGAAILLDNGKIVLGSNQENAAYPSGLCAERVAIFHAGAIYPNVKIIKLVIMNYKREAGMKRCLYFIIVLPADINGRINLYMKVK